MKLFADRTRVRQYGVAPLVVGLVCVALYFSGVDALQSLASPKFNREFGLIENIQNGLILWAVVVCWGAARREQGVGWRRLWYVGAVAGLVLFMEEIDWGDHYWSALTGAQRPAGEFFNLHNQGDITTWLKRGSDVGVAFCFIILPAARRLFPAKLRGLLPDLHSALTLIAGALVSALAHNLEDAGFPNNGSLHKNISEFREIFTYTVGALYAVEISRRRLSVADSGSPSSDG